MCALKYQPHCLSSHHDCSLLESLVKTLMSLGGSAELCGQPTVGEHEPREERGGGGRINMSLEVKGTGLPTREGGRELKMLTSPFFYKPKASHFLSSFSVSLAFSSPPRDSSSVWGKC